MRKLLLYARSLLAIFFAASCGENSISPPTMMTSPRTETIRRDSIPRPFTSDTYFRYFFPDNAGTILDSLRSNGFALRNAWEANGDGPCMRLEPTVLVVQLMLPNPEILSFGFSTDSSWAVRSCTTTWRHYKF